MSFEKSISKKGIWKSKFWKVNFVMNLQSDFVSEVFTKFISHPSGVGGCWKVWKIPYFFLNPSLSDKIWIFKCGQISAITPTLTVVSLLAVTQSLFSSSISQSVTMSSCPSSSEIFHWLLRIFALVCLFSLNRASWAFNVLSFLEDDWISESRTSSSVDSIFLSLSNDVDGTDCVTCTTSHHNHRKLALRREKHEGPWTNFTQQTFLFFYWPMQQ